MAENKLKNSDDLKPRGQKRVDVQAKVNMEFERFSGFVSEYSNNISEGGMFIRTDSPQPIGSVFSFEFRLADDIKLIQGWGEVAWLRDSTTATEEDPAGMGIKFIDLDDDSRNLIKRIVSTREKGGDDLDAMINRDGKASAPKVTIENLNVPSSANPSGSAIASSIADVLVGEEEVAGNHDLADFGFGDDPDSKTERIDDEALSFEDVVADESDDIDALLDDGADSDFELVGEKKRSPLIWVIPIVLGVAGAGGYFFLKQDAQLLFKNGIFASNPSEGPLEQQPAPEKQPPNGSLPNDPVVNEPVQNGTKTALQDPTPTPIPTATPDTKQAIQAQLAPARAVKAIKLVKNNEGKTIFLIQFDGAVGSDAVKIFELSELPPRVVLDVGDISQPFSKNKIAVKKPLVKGLRLGIHRNPEKLRIVFDLNRKLSLAPTYEIVGDSLRIAMK